MAVYCVVLGILWTEQRLKACLTSLVWKGQHLSPASGAHCVVRIYAHFRAGKITQSSLQPRQAPESRVKTRAPFPMVLLFK